VLVIAVKWTAVCWLHGLDVLAIPCSCTVGKIWVIYVPHCSTFHSVGLCLWCYEVGINSLDESPAFIFHCQKWKQCPRARLYLVTPRDHNYNKNVKAYQFCNLECKWSAWVKLFEGFLSVTYLTDRGLGQWVSWLLCLSWGLACISFTLL
jgi:hypothetical protein